MDNRPWLCVIPDDREKSCCIAACNKLHVSNAWTLACIHQTKHPLLVMGASAMMVLWLVFKERLIDLEGGAEIVGAEAR